MGIDVIIAIVGILDSHPDISVVTCGLEAKIPKEVSKQSPVSFDTTSRETVQCLNNDCYALDMVTKLRATSGKRLYLGEHLDKCISNVTTEDF